MTVIGPGFSERVFEFSFNAEYADRNQAVLAGAPSIPTQNEEKWLGYDVEFAIKQRGGAVHAVALQHKVSRYVDRLASTNEDFWNSIGGPYYAFRLDTDQYNLIEAVASAKLPGIEFYYCAPIFAARIDMNKHYLGGSVEANSIWIDVACTGQIKDQDVHTIVYSPGSPVAFLHSKHPVRLEVVSSELRRSRKQKREGLDHGDFRNIYQTAFAVLSEYWPKRRRPERAGDDFRLPGELPEEVSPSVVATARLLSSYFGLSLLVEVRK